MANQVPAPALAFDVAGVREQFPALRAGAAHFDGPGGSQTPEPVARAIHQTLVSPLSNRGSSTPAERNAETAVFQARSALGDLLGADPAGIVFGRSMSQLTFDMARTMAKNWGPDDEVVVTRLDHDANIRSWVHAARAVGATVRFADFDPQTGELDPVQIERVLTPKTRLVALTAASNLIGTIPDLSEIAALVHAVGAWFYVDAVHFTAHAPVDMVAWGADIVVCSPYKFLGPHCGVLAGRPEILDQLDPDRLLPAPSNTPEKFELGTLPYELMAGTTAAIDFLTGMVPAPAGPPSSRRDRIMAAIAVLESHEDRLRVRIETGLRSFPGATIHSRAARRTPTLLVTFDGHDVRDISRFLAERGVNAPAGSFYAVEASHRLGLRDEGGLRIGLAPYNDDSDVVRLLDALTEFFDAASGQ